MEIVCQKCGDVGYPEYLIFCKECKLYAEHRYCLDKFPSPDDDEDVTWLCEECSQLCSTNLLPLKKRHIFFFKKNMTSKLNDDERGEQLERKKRRLILEDSSDEETESVPSEKDCKDEDATRIVEANDYVFSSPIIDPIWRGFFETDGQCYGRIVAHLSNKFSPRVFDVASRLDGRLHLQKKPRNEAWPKSFSLSPPTDDNIALYFFPESQRDDIMLNELLDEINRLDLVLTTEIDNAQLLLISSLLLPKDYWRFCGKCYIWGVFRGRQLPNSGATCGRGYPKLIGNQDVGVEDTSHLHSGITVCGINRENLSASELPTQLSPSSRRWGPNTPYMMETKCAFNAQSIKLVELTQDLKRQREATSNCEPGSTSYCIENISMTENDLELFPLKAEDMAVPVMHQEGNMAFPSLELGLGSCCEKTTNMVEGTSVKDQWVKMMKHLQDLGNLGMNVYLDRQKKVILGSLPKWFEPYANFLMNNPDLSLSQPSVDLGQIGNRVVENRSGSTDKFSSSEESNEAKAVLGLLGSEEQHQNSDGKFGGDSAVQSDSRMEPVLGESDKKMSSGQPTLVGQSLAEMPRMDIILEGTSMKGPMVMTKKCIDHSRNLEPTLNMQLGGFEGAKQSHGENIDDRVPMPKNIQQPGKEQSLKHNGLGLPADEERLKEFTGGVQCDSPSVVGVNENHGMLIRQIAVDGQYVLEKFKTTKMVEGSSVKDHMAKMMKIVQDLMNLGMNVAPDVQREVILSSLPKCFKPSATEFFMKNHFSTLPQLVVDLEAEELRLTKSDEAVPLQQGKQPRQGHRGLIEGHKRTNIGESHKSSFNPSPAIDSPQSVQVKKEPDEHYSVAKLSKAAVGGRKTFDKNSPKVEDSLFEMFMSAKMVEGTPVRVHMIKMKKYLQDLKKQGHYVSLYHQRKAILSSLPDCFRQCARVFFAKNPKFTLTQILVQLEVAELNMKEEKVGHSSSMASSDKQQPEKAFRGEYDSKNFDAVSSINCLTLKEETKGASGTTTPDSRRKFKPRRSDGFKRNCNRGSLAPVSSVGGVRSRLETIPAEVTVPSSRFRPVKEAVKGLGGAKFPGKRKNFKPRRDDWYKGKKGGGGGKQRGENQNCVSHGGGGGGGGGSTQIPADCYHRIPPSVGYYPQDLRRDNADFLGFRGGERKFIGQATYFGKTSTQHCYPGYGFPPVY